MIVKLLTFVSINTRLFTTDKPYYLKWMIHENPLDVCLQAKNASRMVGQSVHQSSFALEISKDILYEFFLTLTLNDVFHLTVVFSDSIY